MSVSLAKLQARVEQCELALGLTAHAPPVPFRDRILDLQSKVSYCAYWTFARVVL